MKVRACTLIEHVETKQRSVVPQGGTSPVFTSTGSDQAAHDSSFKSFISYSAASTLRDAVTKKLEDVSGETARKMAVDSSLTY